MFSSILLLTALAAVSPLADGTDLAPGDALELGVQPVPIVRPATPPARAVPAGTGRSPAIPGAFGALGALVAGAALFGGMRGPRRDDDPLFVMVPGCGSASGEDTFRDLIEYMGLDPEDVAFFDYRMAVPLTDHVAASTLATVDATVAALEGFLTGLSSGTGRRIELVGHSKGGAAMAELVARWDDRGAPIDTVTGATILDAPMATGIHGELQSFGVLGGLFPNDGGYDPVECLVGTLGCTDDRVDLGEASGVHVTFVMNPDSTVTTMNDTPAGMRMYAVPDDGPSILSLWYRPWAVPGRATEAHDEVLHSPAVAECILNEAELHGTCGLPRVDRALMPASWYGRPSFGVTGNRVR